MANAVSGILLLVLGGGLALSPAATADVFCDNLKQVAATLPNTTASSPSHFATTVFGQAPDTVYALALCRGDVVNDTVCGDCVAREFGVLNSTPPRQERCNKTLTYYYFGSVCVLAYSVDDILASLNTAGGKNNGQDTPYARWSEMSWISFWSIDEPQDSSLTVVGLIHELLLETVRAAASSTTAPRRFATGVMDSGTKAPLVYSLAQCTPNLSADSCLACLSRLIGMVNSTMAMRTGAQIHVLACYFRYDSYVFYSSQPMLHLGPPAAAPTTTPATTTAKHKWRMNNFWAIPIVVVPVAAAGYLCFIFGSPWLRMRKEGMGLLMDILKQDGKLTCYYKATENFSHVHILGPRRTGDKLGEEDLVWQGKSSEFMVFDFEQLLEATDNFSEENKLGQGGFGAVYKGQFPQGLEIAVKRLSSHSGQGFIEFKNEVQLIAKLQHRNLVRLLGCCSQEEEKILVYEYLPNKSLDFFIFGENRRALLDWIKRIAIIEGIAHGLLYLHKHSRLRVIHRDLKPSNIFLDGEMNPKISDFGLAKISNNTEKSTTRRVVGTYGYMAAEYAYEGLFSIKSDLFSFGLLVLEILCGKRNSANGHECGNFINLLGYAWKLFEEERWSELIDASLDTIGHSEEMMRCMNIAFMCVQEKAADRPTMSDVVAMLGNKSMVLVKPKHPAYFNLSSVGNEEASTAMQPGSINDVTISIATGR